MASSCSERARTALLAGALTLVAGNADAAPAKRPLPDYDGRKEPTTVGDVAVWPPRVVLFPLYLTTEYVIRRPLGALATTAEKNHWPTKIVDFFTFDKEHKSGIIPTGFYEFGFRPSLGAYFFWDDALFRGNAFRAHAGTWGADWISAAVAERITFREGNATFTLRGEYTRRPDGIFAGLGPRSLERDFSRFGFTRITAGPALDVRLWRSSMFRAWTAFRSMSFRDDEQCCGDPTLRETVAAGRLTHPPGFKDGYTIIEQGMELALDTRIPGGTATGVRWTFDAEHAGDVRDQRARQWVRYSSQLGGFVDLDGKGRTLGMIVSAFFADPLGDHEVPFAEQVGLPLGATQQGTFAGVGALRGFRPGRLVGRSAFVTTLQYSWPIWIWLDGTLHVAAGNVFGKHLDGFDPKLTRFSTGIGFRTVGSPDHQFEFLIGTGTETIEDGLRPNLIRILFGATRGF